MPIHDDAKHFEFLTLETMQCGLSWQIVLVKREALRQAFSGFEPQAVAQYTNEDVDRLMETPGIIKNKQKIKATINNALSFLRLQDEHGSFDRYLWQQVDNKTIIHTWATMAEIPATSALSQAISADMKTRGFKFLGPVVIYSHLQSAGLINDHIVTCFRYKQLVK